ncbi:MAG: ankyrin repeat domain-containing protein [Desulfovermiculus sp.]
MNVRLFQPVVLVCFAVTCLLIWNPVWAGPGDDNSESITVLKSLKSEGKLTVRAMRAWGQLPEKFMALAFDLRPLGIDLMNADIRTVRELTREADENEQLRPLLDDLQALAGYMAEFGPQEPESGNSGKQSLQGQTEINADALVPVAEQEVLARDLFTRIGALKDYDLEGMEELYLQVIAQAPETRLAHESYWRLSNMYMQAFSQPRNKEAITLLEKYLQRYPNSFVLDEQFALFATPGLPVVQKRLVHLYAQEEMWEKAGDLYAQLIPDLDEANQKLLQYFIAYGRALENSDRKEQAISVYQAYLRNVQKPSQTLERAARNRLQALGGTIPESQAQISYDNLHEATIAGNLEEVQRLVAQGADISAQWNKGYQDTPLQMAVSKGHLHIAEYLLDQGADPNLTGKHSIRPPLILAAENADIEMAALLLQAGADVHVHSAHKGTALDIAAADGSRDLVQLFLNHGASLEEESPAGRSPLHAAVENSQQEAASLLIAAGAELNTRDKHGRTPLVLALLNNDLELGKMLLAAGAGVDEEFTDGNTFLHLAAGLKEESENWVKQLIDAGADVSKTNEYGLLAFDFAVRENNVRSAELLFSEHADLELVVRDGMTRLHEAIVLDRMEMAQALMELGADVNAQTDKQETPLMLAVQRGKEDLAAQLLTAGSDSNRITAKKRAAVHMAITQRDVSMLGLLLKHGADPDLADAEGKSPLIQILSGFGFEADTAQKMCRLLVQAGADVKGKDSYGHTLLHLAASKGYTQIVGLLLDQGLNIDAFGARERTALHQAASAGHTDTVHLLINRGADLKARDKQGESASSLAFAREHGEIVALLRKHGVAVYDNLRQAAVEGEAEDVRLHIQQGANVHAVDDDQNTALHVAAREGHQEVALVLVESGADVQARNTWNAAPVHYAAGYGHLNVAELLINHGTPKDLLREEHALNEKGSGALHYAVMNESKEAAKYLLEAGIKVDVRDDQGRTPLHLAAMEGDRSLLNLLLKHGADLDARDDQGFTPLHLAVVHWQPQIVETFVDRGAKPGWEHVGPTLLIQAVEEENISSLEYLLAQGIDINAQSEKGYSALHAAAATGEPSLVDFLLDQGADPNLQDAQGNTPLSLAAEDTSNAWDLESAELLIARGAKEDLQKIGWPQLRIAALQGDGQRVKSLLKENPEQLNYDGEQWAWSILHAASMAGHADVVQLLIESGGDVNEESANRKKPVFSAAMAGHREVVELLTAHGADLQQLHFYLGSAIGSSSPDKELVARLVNAGVDLNSIAGPKSLPALFLARDLDMLEYLIGLGADVNQPVFEQPGFTLLAHSVEQGDREKVALLLEHGAEIDSGDEGKDETFLHMAVDRGDMDMVKLLVTHGAEINAQDIDGITPLHRAVEDNNLPLVTYLLQHGADTTIEDEYGRTPRDEAKRSRDIEILRAIDAG